MSWICCDEKFNLTIRIYCSICNDRVNINMFKIPAWEDDVPRIDTSFLQKTKKKEKTTTPIKSKPPVVKHVKEKNSNLITNGNNKLTRKRKLDNKINTKEDKTTNIKKKTLDVNTILETQNFDEILINAKRKKFNEIIENEDKEDLLFTENEQKKGKKKKNSQNNTIINKSTESVVKQNKANGKVNGTTEYVDAKKARLKLLLERNSNRNHINITKTGNKLRDRMLERLKAAQFRYLNEKLYTSSGSEAQQLFQSDPSAFETYHQGYQLQVKKWPVNPLDVIVKKIMKMPKTHMIADLGCGEAALSRRVPHKVRSFDLVATAPGVEACDMARTPLLSASMDVTVYCLALMGTDLTQYLVEANRVLKMGGHLLIAEVESRFDKVENFAKEVERLGFKLKQLDKSNNVFFFMEFTKIRDPPVKKAKLPVLTLKPCLYKRR